MLRANIVNPAHAAASDVVAILLTAACGLSLHAALSLVDSSSCRARA